MPEAWLSSEVRKTKADPYGRWLSSTFATAYAFDSIVAICAGQASSFAAKYFEGPTGPFRVSPIFLVVAATIVAIFWTDTDVPTDGGSSSGLSLKDALQLIVSDRKILFVGLIQCTFEAAMSIFVLNQTIAIKAASARFFGSEASSVPVDIIFCCYMSCCLIGSNLYAWLTDRFFRPERIMIFVLTIAAIALVLTSFIVSADSNIIGFFELSIAFFVFEICVGIYFPSISFIRSKYLPGKSQSIIMTIVAVCFNILVLSISLSAKVIGVTGAWATAGLLLFVAVLSLIQLQRIAEREASANMPQIWNRVKAKCKALSRVLEFQKLTRRKSLNG